LLFQVNPLIRGIVAESPVFVYGVQTAFEVRDNSQPMPWASLREKAEATKANDTKAFFHA